MIETTARVSHPPYPRARRWLPPLSAFTGAATFLYATTLPLLDSPLIGSPRLMRFSGLDSRTLVDVLPLFVPIVAGAAAVSLVVASGGVARLARGALLSSGLVGIALIVHDAGGLIDIKGGVPAAGALMGFGGASLILAASVLAGRRRGFEDDARRLRGSLRLVGPIVIFLGVVLFTVALLLPWTTRPFPLRLVSLPPASPYWFWSIVVPSAIILPVIVAGVRMLPGLRQRQTEFGVAAAGGIFATLLFVQVVGRVTLSSSGGPPGLPPVFVLETGAYLGMASGALIAAGASFWAFSLRRSASSHRGAILNSLSDRAR